MIGLVARLPRTSRLLHAVYPPCRALAVALVLVLSACVNQPGTGGYAGPISTDPNAPAPGIPVPGRRIAILLPLTGPRAEVGQVLLKAAQLALNEPGSPPLDQQDTAGTPDGAVNAARAALAAGDGIILGPLTAEETAAAGPIARAAGVPMLAFTSNAAQAQPGVWPLGITFSQQMRRLVLAVQAEGKTRIATVLPQNALGDALSDGLLSATTTAGLPAPNVVRAPATFAGFNQAFKNVSDFSNRRGAIEAEQRAARASNDADGRHEAAVIGQRTPPPPPMDTLLLGSTGELLGQTTPLLAFYDITPAEVRILGPGTWIRDAARQPALAGAWFAAPDPGARSGFEQQFTAKYNIPARDFTSLAYDAAGIARAIATPQGFPLAALTRPEGFAGADGVLGLQPDGHVRRGLAIFQVDHGGAHIVQPAPQTLSAPGA